MGTNFFEFRDQVTPGRKPKAVKPIADAQGALTVSQLTSQVDGALKSAFPSAVLVRGEVSNFRPNAASGHLYFTMKDAGACLNCVMFQSEAKRLRFQPADGMELLARGSINVYRQQGKYQLNVDSLQPLGKGALEIALQQLRRKLEAEGLFAPDRKRPLPAYPMRIALVTSSQTAALQDMLKVLRRFPWLALMVYHVPVQGDGCGKRIADAIEHISRRCDTVGGVDVLILSRGGGSLEDLWGFNEESVARAVAACRIPVVTGIGHEIDTSIADLVADYHAHTPTEAAQVVVAQWRGVRENVFDSVTRLRRGIRVILQHSRQRLIACERHETFRRPLDRVNALRQLLDDRERALLVLTGDRLRAFRARVERFATSLHQTPPTVLLLRQRQRVSEREQVLSVRMLERIRRKRDQLADLTARLAQRHPRNAIQLANQRLDGLARHLSAIAPEYVLRRGYSITRRKRDGYVVRSIAEVRPGDRLVTRVADGQVESVVDDAKQPRLFE